MTLQQDRIAKGQCPNDGKEAAPYRLCYDCRQKLRLTRALNRGVRHGVIKTMAGTSRVTMKSTLWLGDKADDPEANKQWSKWSTKVVLPETDRRGDPRLRGIRVDVEATLIAVMQRIGRPCTIDEITAAWGKLRSKRADPLPTDLANIIKAADKRARKALKRAEIDARQGAQHDA